MNQSTEDLATTQVSKSHRTCWVTHRRYGRAQAEAAVRAVLVVVLDVAAQDANKVLAADDQEVVEAFSADVPTQRSATALALGARIGVQMVWTPVERQTSSNALVKLVSGPGSGT
jgi:hypothetical protein